MSDVTIKDLEIVQTLFNEAGLDYQLELEGGKISVMGPSDIVSSEITISMFNKRSDCYFLQKDRNHQQPTGLTQLMGVH
ncbi:MAG: hypothetical protein QNJ68_07135 [Microcoleaceae cyanobacterium MO_207.B10]|nr:hypothetical protein [Microcoleaceae cyanobacterium MO_207.B10]